MRYFAEVNSINVVVNAWVVYEGDIPQGDNIIEYSIDKSITSTPANIGYTYRNDLNAFIPPQPDPTYSLNTETFEWEPDEHLLYDLHHDGKLYQYKKELKGWIPTWGPEES